MDWDLILKYRPMVIKIANKYSGDSELAEDVTQEVLLRLKTDKNLDVTKFDPKKIDAAIRNTIRNKVLKVLTSRKFGRKKELSLDIMLDSSFFQIEESGKVISSPNNKLSKLDTEDGDLGIAGDYDYEDLPNRGISD